MKLSPPTQAVFLISLILFVLALVGHFASLPFVSENRFWLSIASWVVLAVGCLMKGR